MNGQWDLHNDGTIMGPSLPPTATVEATTKFGISEGRQDAMVSDNACIASSAKVLSHSLPFPHISEYSNNAAALLGFSPGASKLYFCRWYQN